jgi:hypothetical protein
LCYHNLGLLCPSKPKLQSVHQFPLRETNTCHGENTFMHTSNSSDTRPTF